MIIMKMLIWKIEYAFRLRRLLRIPLKMCWESAGATIESVGDDWKVYTPQEAAEDEVDAWRSCC
jgi:hypothetical protein